MRSFLWLVQRLVLTLLLGVAPLIVAGCGDDSGGTPAKVSVVLTALEIAPTTQNIGVGGKQVFNVSSATVELDGTEKTFDADALANLDQAVEDKDITEAQRDAIYAALEKLVWASSDKDVATVKKVDAGTAAMGETQVPSLSAEATGVANGSADITATVAGDVANAADTESEDVVATAKLTVGDEPADSLSVDPSPVRVAVGASETLEVTASIDGKDVDVTDKAVFASKDTKTATVDSKGVVKGVAPGETSVEVSYGGQTETVAVTVENTVGDLVVTPASDTVAIGLTAVFKAEATFADGTMTDVTDDADWSVDDTAIATADGEKITGKAKGTTKVVATFGDVSASADLEVTDATLESIAISPADSTIYVGGNSTYSVEGTLSDGTKSDVTADADFSVDDDTIVSFAGAEATGLVAGDVVITADVNGVTATTNLAVLEVVTETVTVLPPTVSIPAGVKRQLAAAATNNNGTPNADAVFTWASSDETIATVDDEGLVTAVAAGTATITAEVDGVEGTSEVTVTAIKLVSLTVEPGTADVALGATPVFSAQGTYDNSQTLDVTATVDWVSSNPAVASIVAGTATTLSEGTTTITATLGDQSATATLTVTKKTIEQIVVSPSPAVTNLGVSVQMMATAQYSDGTEADVTTQADWASSDTGIATIDDAGLAAPVAVGTTTLTATLETVSGSAPLVVSDKNVTAVAVTPATATLAVGQTQALTAQATFSDSSSQNVTTAAEWASDAPAIATVSVTGVVTAVTAGTATISATYGGQVGSAVMTVTTATVASIAVTPSTSSVALGAARALVATATYTDGNTAVVTADANVTWTSSVPATATVSNAAATKGTVTGVAAGGVTITATFSDGVTSASGTATVTVTNKVPVSIAVLPATRAVPVGFTADFRAEATYSDSSTGDVTADAVWSSANTATATVLKSGSVAIATGVAGGVTQIRASLAVAGGGAPLTASGELTVETRTLASIVVAPADKTIAKGGTQAYTATGFFTTGPSIDVTRVASWTVEQPTACVADCVATPFNTRVSINTDGVATAVESTVDTESLTVYKALIRAAVEDVSGTATLGVTSNVIVDVSLRVEDGAGNDVDQLAVGHTLGLKADCRFQDGRIEENCEGRLTFTASNSAATIDNTSKLVTGVSAGTLNVTANPPAGAITGVTINTVALEVRDCVYDTVTVLFDSEGTPNLPLGATAQAYAQLSGGGCDAVVLNNAVSWQSKNTGAVDVDQSGAITVLASPTPAVEDWSNVGPAKGLSVNIEARYIKGNVELTGQSPVILRDACINELIVTPAIQATMPIIAGGNAPAQQQLNVVGKFSIDIPNVTLTGDDALGYDPDGEGSVYVDGDGILNVAGGATAGVQTITVSAGQGLVGGSPVCSGGAEGTTDVTLVSSAVTSVDVTAARTTIGVGELDVAAKAVATFVSAAVGSWDVTEIVNWTSSNTDILTVDEGDPRGGLMSSAGGEGSSVVSGVLGALTDSITIQVRDRTLLSVEVGADPAFAQKCDFVLTQNTNGLEPLAGLASPVPTNVRIPFKAYATYSNGDHEDVTSQATFATINGGALLNIVGNQVTTAGVGDTGVRATFQNKTSDPMEFTTSTQTVIAFVVTPAPENVGLNEDTMPDGTSRQYGSMATWVGGDSCDVTGVSTWSISPPAAGTSASPGLIKLTPGNNGADVDFTATYGVGPNTAVRNIKVGDACVANISVAPATLNLAQNTTGNATVTLTLSSGAVVNDPTTVIGWSSSNANVVVDGGTGLVGGFGAALVGNATVTATYNDGDGRIDICAGSADPLVASLDVAVKAAVQSVAVNCDNDFDNVGPNFNGGTFRSVDAVGGNVIPVGVRGFCRAIATFTDASTQDVTETATWSVVNSALATMTAVVDHEAGEGPLKFKTFSTVAASPTPTQIKAAVGAVEGLSSSFTVLQPSAVSVKVRAVHADGSSLVNDSLPIFTAGTNPKQYHAVGIFTISGEPKAYELTQIANWSSQIPAVATVSGGLVTPLTAGSTVVTATHPTVTTAKDNLTITVFEDTCQTLSIKDPSSGPAAAETLALGQMGQFTAQCTLTGSGDVVDVTELATWTSSIPSVATVSGAGLVSASSTITGNTTITAAVGAVTNNFALTVEDACIEAGRWIEVVQGVQPGDSVPAGVPVNFVLEARRSNTVNFSKESETGLMTVEASSYTVTGSLPFCDGPQIVTFAFTGVASDVTSVVVSPSSTSVPQGVTAAFTAAASFADGKTYNVTDSSALDWEIADGTLASNEGGGEFDANTNGTNGQTTVTATLNDDESGGAGLTVTSAVLASITAELFQSDDTDPCELPSSSIGTLETGYYSAGGASHPKNGYTTQARVRGTFTDGSQQIIDGVVFSDNSETTFVDPSTGAIVTGGTAGPVVVTATVGTFTDNVTLTVVDAVLTGVTVTTAASGSGAATLALGQTTQLHLVGTFGAGGSYCITPDATWSTMEPNPVKVSSTGVASSAVVGSDSVTGAKGLITDDIAVSVVAAVIKSIRIDPVGISLTPNSTAQLRAFATLTNDAVIEVTSSTNLAKWSVSGNGVSVSNGLVTSNGTSQTVQVTITSDTEDSEGGTSKIDTVDVVVGVAP